MKFFAFITSVVSAIAPEQLTDWQPDEDPGHLSLPNLLDLKDIKDLDLTWNVLGNTHLDTGRLLFDNRGPGSVWSIAGMENTATEWTVEVVFRSSGVESNAFSNGVSFWLVNEANSDPLSGSNYGGPERFDGFQFLLNHEESEGLKIFSGDGTETQPKDIAHSIGNCAFAYRDSQIPFTIRISYSRASSLFKVQVDNNLCFKTDKISIPLDSTDFKFGFSSYVDPQSQESIELFKVKVWSHLTLDAIDDHGILSDGSKKIVYKTVTSVQLEATDGAYVKPGIIRESLMAKSQRQREEIIKQFQAQQNPEDKGAHFDALHQKLQEQLQQQHADMGGSLSVFTEQLLELKNDISRIEKSMNMEDITSAQVQHKSILDGIIRSISDVKTELSLQNAQLLGSITKLNEKVIGEIRDHQYQIEVIGNKVDLLMSNHKDIQTKYDQQLDNYDKRSDAAVIISNVTKWILIPIVIGIIIIFVIVSRLRHDIKHSKLL